MPLHNSRVFLQYNNITVVCEHERLFQLTTVSISLPYCQWLPPLTEHRRTFQAKIPLHKGSLDKHLQPKADVQSTDNTLKIISLQYYHNDEECEDTTM